MAVTIGVPELAVAIGVAARQEDGSITVPADQTEILTRQLRAVIALVDQRAPGAPDDISDEAAIRLAGWLYDVDPAQLRFGSNPMLHSGAGTLLAPWRRQTLVGPTDRDVAPVTPGGGLPALPDATDTYALLGVLGRVVWRSLREAFERELYAEFVGGELPMPGDQLVIDEVDSVQDRLRITTVPREAFVTADDVEEILESAGLATKSETHALANLAGVGDDFPLYSDAFTVAPGSYLIDVRLTATRSKVSVRLVDASDDPLSGLEALSAGENHFTRYLAVESATDARLRFEYSGAKRVALTGVSVTVFALATGTPSNGGKPAGGWKVSDLAAAVVARLLPDGFNLSTLATDAELAAAVANLATDAELAAAVAGLASTAALTARVPSPIPAPASASRGFVIRQKTDGETFELAAVSGTGGGTDAVARAAAAKAEKDAEAAQQSADAASEQARDVQHLAEDNLAHIDALEDGGLLTTGYGAWALWTEAESHAGFQLATSLDNSFDAGDFHGGSNVFSGVTQNRRLAISVPAGVDPERVRVRLTLSGSESFKPGSGEEWRAFNAANANSQRDYYYLAVAASGNHAVVTFAANDRVDLQIRPVVPVAGVTKRQVLAALAAVQDVIIGDVVDPNWEAVKAGGTEGGITSAIRTWTLDNAKTASYSAPSVNASENSSQVVRIPAAADARHYRIVIAGVSSELVNHFLRLGTDANWKYYEQSVALPDAAMVTLEVSDRTLGHTTWAGALSAALMARMAPALAGKGGKFLAINARATAVEAVDAPSGGGGGGWTELARFNLANNTNRQSFTTAASGSVADVIAAVRAGKALTVQTSPGNQAGVFTFEANPSGLLFPSRFFQLPKTTTGFLTGDMYILDGDFGEGQTSSVDFEPFEMPGSGRVIVVGSF